MSNLGVQEIYYTRNLPGRSVAIAQVEAPALLPSQLTDINNTPFATGTLQIWKYGTSLSSPPDYTAPDYGQTVMISGVSTYIIDNQFFQMTNYFSQGAGIPYYYYHDLPTEILQGVKIVDLNGVVQPFAFDQVGSRIYHDCDGGAYFVRYVDSSGFLQQNMLQYDPVISMTRYYAIMGTYTSYARVLNTYDTSVYGIRFVQPNGYQLLTPYQTAPNDAWYPRIRFSLDSPCLEWTKQIWAPYRPYMLATWVAGQALSDSVIEFERKNIYYDPDFLPDILVFDKDNAFRYALEGTATGLPRRRGSLYNWKRGLIKDIDPTNGRVQVSVSLNPTDIIFGFYSYNEQDLIYMPLDVNPFTNPNVRNRVIQFYYKTDPAQLYTSVYHQVLDETGAPVVGLTNDTNPTYTPKNVFAEMIVGTAVGPTQITIQDARTRGGGLAPAYQSIPEAINMWDLGYWDGKPWPIGGALVVYLPSSILERMSRDEISSGVRASFPMGTLPVVRFYYQDGSESI